MSLYRSVEVVPVSVAKIEDQEGELLNVIEEINPLEWRKYQQRFPKVWVNGHFERGDRSGYPPFVAFRFAREDADLIDQLKDLVDGYQGDIKWVLVAHKREELPGVNWMITPRRMVEVRGAACEMKVLPGKYLEENEPDLGPKAYADMIALTAYIKENLLSLGR